MPETKFQIKLDIENIGPHYDTNKISFHDSFNSNKAIIFARNGSGKSFITRVFRLVSNEKRFVSADDVLTLEKDSGKLSFSLLSNGVEKELSVSVRRGSVPEIKNDTGLIFHVFNSDYVDENIKSHNYSPDGQIDGYILGKTQIDLSAEREEQRNIELQIEEKNKEISSIIYNAKMQLRDNGLLPTIREFELIDIEHLRSIAEFINTDSFEKILSSISELSKIPELITDISIPIMNTDYAVFDELVTILKTSYPKTEWDNEFVNKIISNRSFFESGLQQLGNLNTCPFCSQSLKEPALKLINDYKLFLSDNEAIVRKKIENKKNEILRIIDEIKRLVTLTKLANADFLKIQSHFRSLNKYQIIIPEQNLDSFLSIITLLDLKNKDLSVEFLDIIGLVNKCQAELDSIQYILNKNAKIISEANKKKDNTNSERLTLRRDLCKAQFNRLKFMLEPYFAECAAKQEILESIKNSIKEKELATQISKRSEFCTTLDSLLNLFFNNKYSIDRDTFRICFWGKNVGDNVSRILSDGEKSIVAFCLYLASTHILIESEEDYNKLFFIIDDPISSMDFHYVYAVAQSLRNLKTYFPISSYDRMWIFTHNIEFLSIIIRNNIMQNAYILQSGNIELLKKQLVMPYESHLNDIVAVATGAKEPTHTIANSIRHVLETICSFEYPSKKIERYIQEDVILSQDPCIITFCQDLSHGGIRKQPPYTDDMLKEACKTIYNFMNSKYAGQIECYKRKRKDQNKQ